MNLYQIIYVSRNCMAGPREAVEGEIARILSSARRNNGGLGVTGALLFNGGTFAQVLEGPPDAIESIFDRIQCDPRHSDVVLLGNEPCDRRIFSEWSMAYVDPLGARTRPAGCLDVATVWSDPGQSGSRVLQLLEELVLQEAL